MKRQDEIIKYIHVFFETIETGSLTKAAKNLSLGKGTVSRKLDELELLFGCKLTIRNSHGIQLTYHGKKLYQRIKNPYVELTSSIESIKNENNNISGTISIECPIELGQLALGELTSNFIKKYKDINFTINLNSQSLNINHPTPDVKFQFGLKGDEKFIAKKLSTFTSKLYASKKYFKKEKTTIPITIKELKQHHLLTTKVVRNDSSTQWTLHNGKLTETLKIKSPSIEANNIRILREACINGGGIGLFPVQYVKNLELINVLPNWESPIEDVYILFSEKALLTKEVDEFSRWVVKHWHYAL